MKKSDKYIVSGLSIILGTTLLFFILRKGRDSKFERKGEIK
jgi:hypothetical protein